MKFNNSNNKKRSLELFKGLEEEYLNNPGVFNVLLCSEKLLHFYENIRSKRTDFLERDISIGELNENKLFERALFIKRINLFKYISDVMTDGY
ncbi:MAG: hypothetical protein ACRCX2_22660 [Paraclostridium sp.]